MVTTARHGRKLPFSRIIKRSYPGITLNCIVCAGFQSITTFTPYSIGNDVDSGFLFNYYVWHESADFFTMISSDFVLLFIVLPLYSSCARLWNADICKLLKDFLKRGISIPPENNENLISKERFPSRKRQTIFNRLKFPTEILRDGFRASCVIYEKRSELNWEKESEAETAFTYRWELLLWILGLFEHR